MSKTNSQSCWKSLITRMKRRRSNPVAGSLAICSAMIPMLLASAFAQDRPERTSGGNQG